MFDNKSLWSIVLKELLHAAMHSPSALECFTGQASIDLLIPVYTGYPLQVFDSKLVTAVCIQVKNRAKADHPFNANIIAKNHFDFLGRDRRILYLQLEIGLSTPKTQTFITKDNRTFACLFAGDGAKTFAVFEGEFKLQSAMQALRTEMLPKSTGKEKDIVGQYRRFGVHSWAEKYPPTSTAAKHTLSD